MPAQSQVNHDEEIFRQAAKLYQQGAFAKAFNLYLDLASRGRVGCQRFVGWMYFCGEGVERNLEKAYEWFKMATAHEDREAMFGAGRACLLMNREGEAFEWFTKACAQSFPPGCFRLGWMYAHGLGCNRNLELAYQHFRRAYQNGHLPAGRGMASVLMKGCHGFGGRIQGAFLWLRVFFEIVVAAIRDPKSQRFMV